MINFGFCLKEGGLFL